MKPRFLLYMDSCGIINRITISEVPSIIIENAKKPAVPFFVVEMTADEMTRQNDSAQNDSRENDCKQNK